MHQYFFYSSGNSLHLPLGLFVQMLSVDRVFAVDPIFMQILHFLDKKLNASNVVIKPIQLLYGQRSLNQLR